ncbi:MAG TPA: TolC family protein [Isosphaeraceae bacterium]|nr:TolC family protein [Isosphaeraceae bacterium]
MRAIACCILLLSLPACGIPPRRLAQKPPALPESFNGVTSPENSSQLGVVEFYHDPMLLSLIDQALASNRQLKILNEGVQIASNEILARSGAYLPFLTLGPAVGLDRASNRTIEGAALRDDPWAPGRFFSNPHGNYLIGTNFTWQMDIYRQLRNARDAAAQRYVSAIERRNYYMTRLVADIAEDYFRLMALDKRIENLNQIIEFLEHSLRIARARKEFARDTELAVLRFEAEVRRNRSEKLIVNQDIIETENRINFLANRFPQRVERNSAGFYDLNINTLGVGVPSQLLQNRPDIRQAERELEAAGLDVLVARANFYPQLILNAGVGLQAFNIAYLFEPQAVIGNLAASFIGPLVNRRAIRAEYLTSNARQLQAIYDYQRTVLDAFTEVVNRLTAVQNYSQSVEIKKQQLSSLEAAVDVANKLFQFARTEYLDVLTAQRDLRDGRTALIDTKQQQLTAVVRAYQALGGGTLWSTSDRDRVLCPIPHAYSPLSDEDFCSLSGFHYGAGRYYRALRASLQRIVPYRDDLNIRDKLDIPPIDQPPPARIEEVPAPTQPLPETNSADDSSLPPALPPTPPPVDQPGPFGQTGTEDPGVKANGGEK